MTIVYLLSVFLPLLYGLFLYLFSEETYCLDAVGFPSLHHRLSLTLPNNAIALEPNRFTILYLAVSDFVRHFYRLAQKEDRKALGFLRTLYCKRLTSSFYAVQQSLQRRLDTLLTQHCG